MRTKYSTFEIYDAENMINKLLKDKGKDKDYYDILMLIIKAMKKIDDKIIYDRNLLLDR